MGTGRTWVQEAGAQRIRPPGVSGTGRSQGGVVTVPVSRARVCVRGTRPAQRASSWRADLAEIERRLPLARNDLGHSSGRRVVACRADRRWGGVRVALDGRRRDASVVAGEPRIMLATCRYAGLGRNHQSSACSGRGRRGRQGLAKVLRRREEAAPTPKRLPTFGEWEVSCASPGGSHHG